MNVYRIALPLEKIKCEIKEAHFETELVAENLEEINYLLNTPGGIQILIERGEFKIDNYELCDFLTLKPTVIEIL